jgi:hypothetical protein
MKAKATKAKREKKQKASALPSALTVLTAPSSSKAQEPATFKNVFERLEEARSHGQGLEFSHSEVELIYHRFLSIEQNAKRLPAFVEKSDKALPAEIWEFIYRAPTRGTFEADAERNKKWVDFLSQSGWQHFQRIIDTILLGPSGAEKEAAEAIASLVFLLTKKLKNVSRISTPESLAGRDAAKDAYESILTAFHRTVETSKKQKRRDAKYQKRGSRKFHSGDFAFLCEHWARDIIFSHEAWLEDATGDPPTFEKFPRPMPTKQFGMDTADRAEWESWFFKAFQHKILKCSSKKAYMNKQWRSHSSDLRNRLIPSYWDMAQMWRSKRENIQLKKTE